MLEIAKNTIKAKLEGRKYIPPKDLQNKYSQIKGCFVTIKINEFLRGCIGIIEPTEQLWKSISIASEAAAFEDPRFKPLNSEEFEKIKIEISVLSEPKEINNIEEIEVGKNGLIIEKGHNKGLLLPQVATEQKWNKQELLENTCFKAGLGKECWKDKEVKILKFNAKIYK